jgi:hypothetical protein
MAKLSSKRLTAREQNSWEGIVQGEPNFAIGTEYMTRGKCPHKCIVTDVLKTYNYKNELVKIRYMSTHEFMGQTVTDYDVLEVTVAMGEIKKPESD